MANPWLELLIYRARNGDQDATRALYGWLADCLEAGEVPPVELRDHFASEFRRVSQGAPFNLARDRRARDLAIARRVCELTHRGVGRLPLRGSQHKKGAYDIVAKQNRLTADRIEQIYKKYRTQVVAELFDLNAPSSLDVLAFARLFEALNRNR